MTIMLLTVKRNSMLFWKVYMPVAKYKSEYFCVEQIVSSGSVASCTQEVYTLYASGHLSDRHLHDFPSASTVKMESSRVYQLHC